MKLTDPIKWITTNFYVPELSGPVTLAPYQVAALREALSVDSNGLYNYSTVLWSDIKKSIKSTIAAAVGLYLAYRQPWSSIRVVANDLKQADSRVMEYMRRAVTLNPHMSGAKVKPSGYKITLPNNSVIEAVPIDPAGEAGGNDDLVIFSELWAAKHKAIIQMWSEMTLSPMKYGKSLRWVETYAGYRGESPLLEELYDQARIKDKLPDLKTSPVYIDRMSRLFALWNTTPRLRWQTDKYYAQEATSLVPEEFNRLHRNQWASPVERFLDSMIQWDKCKQSIPLFDDSEPIILAADAAVSNDSFGLVGISAYDEGKYAIRFVQEWKPPKGGKIQFHGPGSPDAVIRQLCQEHNIVQLSYDPYQLHSLAQLLTDDNIVACIEFGQGAPRLTADKNIYDAIINRTLAHDGNAQLREHVENANRQADKDSHKLRIIKRSPKMKIDLLVAASMGLYVAQQVGL